MCAWELGALVGAASHVFGLRQPWPLQLGLVWQRGWNLGELGR